MVELTSMPKEVAQAITAVMAEAIVVDKTGWNDFHKFHYSSIADVFKALQPAMAKAGLAITQSYVKHDVLADPSPGGKPVLLVEYDFLLHCNGASYGPLSMIVSSALTTRSGIDDKVLMKTHSTARKYFVLGLFLSPSEELQDSDADGDGNVAVRPVAPPPRPAPAPAPAAPAIAPTPTAKAAPTAKANKAPARDVKADRETFAALKKAVKEARTGLELDGVMDAFRDWIMGTPPEIRPHVEELFGAAYKARSAL